MTPGQRRVADRVQHILEACEYIESDIGALSKDQFLADGKTQRAVIESIVVIGEASRTILLLLPALEQTDPELWHQLRDAADMRNLLTHEYFRVDPSVVWTTTERHLPGFAKLLRQWAA